jgi:hypothetical protein
VNVSRTRPNGTVQRLGVLDLRLDVSPAGSGVPHHYGDLLRDSDFWQTYVGSWFTDTAGTITLAGRLLGAAPTDGDTYLSVGFTQTGAIS